ncbi:hypothetical protein [Streptomyces canus]|uniref:hypothetical protein n=1 Tax=Streptomyces canus TaxID=58343 RepID=UPI002DDA074C|nr:hypothetical protein [Streptomyces canus]WSD92674.1 hypothetical protein OG925_51370 [Streptomyces canus]
MDVDAAREAIGLQDKLARQRLVPVLRKVAAEGDAHADALTPWLGRAWKRNSGTWGDSDPLGRLKNGAESAFIAAKNWAQESDNAGYHRYTLKTSWEEVRKAVRDLQYHPPSLRQVENSHHDDSPYEGVGKPPPFTRRRHTETAVQTLHDHIRELAELLRKPPNGLLVIPRQAHAPRHGNLEEGRLGRLVNEDLAATVKTGSDLSERLAQGNADWSEAHTWIKGAGNLLRVSLGSVAVGLHMMDAAVAACQSPLIADSRLLARAYTVIALSYMNEVQTRMPDYIEASSQQPDPHVSMTFSGGTFIGGQFAARINNVHSAITGMHQEGRIDVAEALRALQQAVMADSMEDERRSDLLDNVEYLAQAAATPLEERNKGISRAALAALTAAAAGGSALSSALDSWGSVLHKLFS